MINLLLGPPGGGKSYEAVVYHVIPALSKGRLVITNLPLDLDRLAQLDPGWPDLVKKVGDRRGLIQPVRRPSAPFPPFTLVHQPEEGIIRAFSTMDDYAHPWRHAETGAGPLYVIDECHLAMPRGNTRIEVEEWYSLHRHESADVLLITQSYGKVSKSIIDLVQVCYRVKKAVAFGTSKRYIRKVQDGVRGEVVNQSIREYQSRYFGLYKSHTRGGGAELAANDIVPIWKRWPFIGAALFISMGAGVFIFTDASLSPVKTVAPKVAQAKPVKVVEEVNGKVVSATQEDGQGAKEDRKTSSEPVHPYSGRTLHVMGQIGKRVLFAVAQNGTVVSQVDSLDLEKLGYKVEAPTSCAVSVEYDGFRKWSICDTPQVSLGVGPSAERDRSGGARAPGAGGADSVLPSSSPSKPLRPLQPHSTEISM